ncbi:MAG: branched-chain amino acid ABC transporter permease [Lautropia sp.]|nr:MAG: branched-chain amino acid ABC transporter permease [Pseudomonadota bacterium]MBC6960024.1 branched-chain amino acid ABC transporter permease [Lautropia sp.]MCL4701933.1 branched-chain amino acid ABC transporter permease [Burkholderiaceae bacterium]MCZ2412806.1 branched-chain amino acid ABC transporter permease [Burkholderiales bacterium]MDL1907541.1 branched-chain amino acid ABC transporter permease [Betaproteobacteria bacterium PRO1]
MMQYVANGVVLGATLALGAIGLTLTYNILRFANFAHGEFLTFGAYFTLVFAAFFAGAAPIGPLTFGWGFLLAAVIGLVLSALLALVLDRLLFRRLRRSDVTVTLVIASFGASLMLRNVVVFVWSPRPEYFSRTIAVSREIVPGVRMTGDELFVVALTAALMLALHLFLTRSSLGRSMRAVSDDPSLARVAGIDVQAMIRWTWFIGAGLAAVAGILFGLTVQISPEMGFNLILPMFAATILGGIGSIYGAVVGGLIIGLAQELSVPLIGAAYKPAVAFTLMFLILLVYPQGILGDRS